MVKGSLRRFAPLTTPAPTVKSAPIREDADLWSACVVDTETRRDPAILQVVEPAERQRGRVETPVADTETVLPASFFVVVVVLPKAQLCGRIRRGQGFALTHQRCPRSRFVAS